MKTEVTRFHAAVVLSVAALLVLVGCGKEEEEAPPDIVRPVKTAVVQGFGEGELMFPGIVDAGNKLIMSFRVRGRLIELPVKKGETVKKGQLIARLDPRDYEIAVQGEKATHQRADADFKRYKRLYEQDAVPLADLDQRRSDRDVAKARLEEAEKNLGYTHLRAPFSGMIGNRYVENHMDVQAQQEIVDLNDTSMVEVKINAAENVVAMIREFRSELDVEVFAEFDAAPARRFELTLKELAARADPQTQTFQVTFTMPQPRGITLLPGMTALVRVATTMKPGVKLDVSITVPAIAVNTVPGGGSYVWVVNVDDMTVHKKTVVVGPLRGTGEIAIAEGLEGGEHVVIAGLAQLREGMKVRFWEEQE